MIGAIIFSRFDSSRFPGKALVDIGGRSLLGRVIDRARLAQLDGPVIVATSDRPIDDPICLFAEDEDVEVFRGSLNDVAARALACARSFHLDAFARICGDRPFHCPKLLGHLADLFKKNRLDLATNVLTQTYPSGLTVEIVSTEALQRVITLSQDPLDREHVTRYFYRHAENFRINNVKWDFPEDAAIHLALDDPEDLEFAHKMIAALPENPEIASHDIVIREARRILSN